VVGWTAAQSKGRGGPVSSSPGKVPTRAIRSADAAGVLVDGETIEGHLFFHLGDDSTFRAEPVVVCEYQT
jgi:hypothetical protein